jgi:hypothetical protein
VRRLQCECVFLRGGGFYVENSNPEVTFRIVDDTEMFDSVIVNSATRSCWTAGVRKPRALIS